MKPPISSKRKPARICSWLLLALIALLPACAGGGSSEIMVRNWVLEYSAPGPSKAKALPAALKIKRFGAVSGYQGQDMVYRPGPHERGSYPYHNWLLNPADMVGDLLARDLRAAREYRAVYNHHQVGRARFELQGGVLECLELNQPEGWQAKLSLHITVVDHKYKSLPMRLLLQRDFSHTEPIAKKGAPGLARAMSKAADTLSRQIRQELYQAITKRLK